MLSDYMKEKEILENKDNKLEKLIDFFTKTKKIEDSDVHDLADSLDMDPDQFEEIIYGMLTSFWNKGRYNEKGRPSVSISEVEKGIKVEMEHTDNEMMAKRIVLDHLSEIPDYYTRLLKMEKEAGIKENRKLFK